MISLRRSRGRWRIRRLILDLSWRGFVIDIALDGAGAVRQAPGTVCPICNAAPIERILAVPDEAAIFCIAFFV